MNSIEQQLQATDYRPSGFDYLRVALALGVILFHSFQISYGVAFTLSETMQPWRPLIGMLLPMFFGLSGFLIAGSLERCNKLSTFVGLRILRILPALAGEVLLSALLLGPLLTVLPLSDYFSDPLFLRYFLNIIGEVQFHLPGLFPDNPVAGIVNGQLWTIPYELGCYALVIFAGLTRIARKKLGWIMVIAFLLWLQLISPQLQQAPWPLVMPGCSLIITFVCGIVLYRFRARVPCHGVLAALCGLLSLLLLSVEGADLWAPLPISYLTVYLGLRNPPRDRIILSGDYSYGLFLYGAVLQQAAYQLFPEGHSWTLNLALSLPCIALSALFSWWLIEKPALRWRRVLYTRDRR